MRQDGAIEGALTTKHTYMKVVGKIKVARSSRTSKKMEKLLHTITTKGEITLLVSIATS